MNETFCDIDSIIQLSKDSDTLGFDLRAGTSWIYPTNYPVRDYQYNITQAALHQNTLVSLPTGLGKTFIAAVVMYNFYRWYPMGKIIFMAPTKPLVTQQMEACYNIMAIPKNVSAEMTGAKINTSRAKIWKEKRVFFITPHILQNDIDSVLELAPQIRCIVIDEAHKALGKNANCEAIKKIQKINPNFRILALSATPGSNFNSVKDVITNLLISHIEVRTNESIDVAPYVFQRKLDKYIIPITGKLMAVKNEYIKVLDRYTRPLLQHNIFTGNCANLTKGRIVLTMKEFKERGRHHNQYGFILKTLNICVTIYHGYELLIRHGLRAFLQFFKENISKPLINAIGELHGIIDDVERYLGPLDNIEMLPDGTIPEITGTLVYSHPKFEKLSHVLRAHFNEIKDADTRVMVFCEYRESVMEIYTLLLRHRPLIKPRIFLGQGAISQAQQLQAVKMFKSGQCNTLVSTCIGEEGLDVGEVDLIVCFDISSKSPIRMVQRMGRTGRKRDGRVVILVTEGKEEQLLSECLVQRNNMNTLLESQQIKKHLYNYNPKMIPANLIPECNKMYITVSEPEKPAKKKAERKNPKKSCNNSSTNPIKNMFNNLTSSQTSSKSSNDSKNTTSTSTSSKTSSKKQADIRSMFSKISNSQINVIPEVIIIDDEEPIEEEADGEQSQSFQELKELIANIKSYLDTSFISAGCEICNNLFDCDTIINNNNNNIPKHQLTWDDVNSSFFDKITEKSLQIFTQSLKPKIPQVNWEKSHSDELEKTFEFFKLSSTFDLFSEDSHEQHEHSFVVHPVIFNQSTSIFNNYVASPTDLFNSSVEDGEPETNKTPVKIPDEDDLIVGSSTEKELSSPVLNKSRSRKFGIQRRLFSQANSISSNFSKDFKQLESSNDSIMAQQSFNNVSNPKFVSTPKPNIPSTKLEAFKMNETTKKLDNTEEGKNSTSSGTTKTENNITSLLKESQKNVTTSVNNSEKNSILMHDTNFWDESLFENCGSDDDFENNAIENNDYEKNLFDGDELFKNIQLTLEQKNDTQKNLTQQINTKKDDTQEINTDNIKNAEDMNISHDSDETIILSFNTDDIFKNIEKAENTLNSIDKSQMNCDKVNDESLLTVTQMIDLLNKTQHDKSIQSNEIKNTPNSAIKTQQINNSLSNVKIKPDEIINKPSASAIINPINDVIIIDDDILKEFENSDEEQSLLCFSQSIKRKVIDKEQPSILINKQVIEENPQQEAILKDKTFNKSELVPPPSPAFANKNPADEVIIIDDDILKEFGDFDEKLCFSQNKPKVIERKPQQQTDNFSKSEFVPPPIPSSSSSSSLINSRNRSKKMKLSTKRNVPMFSDKVNENVSILQTQDSPIKATKNMLSKKAIILSDSDDDFEVRPKRKEPVVCKITPEKKFKRIKSVTEIGSVLSTKNTRRTKSQSSATVLKTVKGPRKLGVCEFIDDEANVSIDENYISDSDEEKDSMLESSFIHDSQSQSVLDQTDMQAKYLQSIRSPKKYNPFKMPPLPANISIFSQIENNEDNTYMVDSFCVDSDTTLSQRHGLSYLEMVEAKLEKRVKKEKKRKRLRNVAEDSD